MCWLEEDGHIEDVHAEAKGVGEDDEEVDEVEVAHDVGRS